MQTTGHFAARVDQWLGLPYHTLDKMSVREQRAVICKNAAKIRKRQSKQYMRQQVPLTVPLDTEQNWELVKRHQERMYATLEKSVKGSGHHFGDRSPDSSPRTATQTFTTTLYSTKNRSAKNTDITFDMNLPEIMTPALQKKLSSDDQQQQSSPFMNTHMQKRGCKRLLQQIVGKDNDFKQAHSLKQERLHMMRLFSSYSIHHTPSGKQSNATMMYKTATGHDGFSPLKGKGGLAAQAIRLDAASRLTLVCDRP